MPFSQICQKSTLKRVNFNEKEETNELLDASSEISSYINNLPYELLSRIFRNCLGLCDWAMPHIYPNNNTEPFTFLLVCRYWKDVALQDRFLWTSVAVPAYTNELTEADTDTRREFIKKWLSRSRNLPLRVRHIKPARQFTVHIPRFVNRCLPHWARGPIVNRLTRGAEYHAAQMLAALVYVEKQWKSLEIVFDQALLQEFKQVCLTYEPSHRSPCLGASLVRLKISIYERRHLEALPVGDLIMWIANLPDLQILNLKDPAAYIKDLTEIPFCRMKTVKFTRESLRFEEGILVMSLCTSAADVTLVGGKLVEDEEFVADRKILPHLKQLALLGLEYPSDHLNFFTLPALESLEITSDIPRCVDQVTVPLLKQLFDRSQCPLKRLVIEDKYLSVEEAVSILRFPALTNVLDVTLSFQHLLEGISNLVHATSLPGPLYHILDGVNFMVWKLETEECKSCFASGYRMGRKRLEENETFQFALWDDKFVLDNGLWIHG